MSTAQKKYKTTSEAKQALEAQGYKHLFEMVDDSLLRSEVGVEYPSDEFELDEVHKVDENNDDRFTSIYALSSRGGAKGVMLDGFGVTGSVHRTNFLKHVTSKRTIRG